ncbi:MAG: ribonuclease T [Pseudomonadales bacterium]|nr:ribonuclease T [Pseudomonadales bacterium]
MTEPCGIAQRFRGFLPVVIDVETAGFHAGTDALLEIAAVVVNEDHEGQLVQDSRIHAHILPFEGARLDPAALAFNGIDPYNPLRQAELEQSALRHMFDTLRKRQKELGCKRCILVGHNAHFDLGFVNAAIERHHLKNVSPLHPFSVFDTVSLAGMALGQTVLARACKAAGMDFDPAEAHSALYDAQKTAELFCLIINRSHFDLPNLPLNR